MCPDEGGGAAGGRRGWLRVPGRALHVAAAERRGERAAGRPGEGRPDGARAEGDAGGRGAVEEVPAHHQRDDRHQERTVTTFPGSLRRPGLICLLGLPNSSFA